MLSTRHAQACTIFVIHRNTNIYSLNYQHLFRIFCKCSFLRNISLACETRMRPNASKIKLQAYLCSTLAGLTLAIHFACRLCFNSINCARIYESESTGGRNNVFPVINFQTIGTLNFGSAVRFPLNGTLRLHAQYYNYTFAK